MVKDIERFQSKAILVESGCHEWQSTIHRDGYGKFWYRGRQVQAHRVSWILNFGDIPDGLWVLHRCDNRRCVNPEHLYLGTPKRNAQDMIERCKWFGRMTVPFEVVELARRLYAQGLTQQAIADQLGIRQTQVSRYVRRTQRATR